MAVTTDPRFGTNIWGAGTDPWPARAGWNAQLANITGKAAIWLEGTFAARPAFSAAKKGTCYWATDQDRLYIQTATKWIEVSPVGGGGAALAVATNGTGTEGAASAGARADHRHAEPAFVAMTLGSNFVPYQGTPAFRQIGRRTELSGAARWSEGGTGIPGAASMLGTGLPIGIGYANRYPQIPVAMGKNTGSSTDPVGFGVVEIRDDGGLRIYKTVADEAVDVVFLEGVSWRST